ncbi:hypothetical protein BC830DRAFT_1228786 [Chytriomyces sp. MP71]|nr:hypothetical protein BC830DRAFT_1228786 [Chytriomyces sp. MP71]
MSYQLQSYFTDSACSASTLEYFIASPGCTPNSCFQAPGIFYASNTCAATLDAAYTTVESTWSGQQILAGLVYTDSSFSTIDHADFYLCEHCFFFPSNTGGFYLKNQFQPDGTINQVHYGNDSTCTGTSTTSNFPANTPLAGNQVFVLQTGTNLITYTPPTSSSSPTSSTTSTTTTTTTSTSTASTTTTTNTTTTTAPPTTTTTTTTIPPTTTTTTTTVPTTTTTSTSTTTLPTTTSATTSSTSSTTTTTVPTTTTSTTISTTLPTTSTTSITSTAVTTVSTTSPSPSPIRPSTTTTIVTVTTSTGAGSYSLLNVKPGGPTPLVPVPQVNNDTCIQKFHLEQDPNNPNNINGRPKFDFIGGNGCPSDPDVIPQFGDLFDLSESSPYNTTFGFTSGDLSTYTIFINSKDPKKRRDTVQSSRDAWQFVYGGIQPLWIASVTTQGPPPPKPTTDAPPPPPKKSDAPPPPPPTKSDAPPPTPPKTTDAPQSPKSQIEQTIPPRPTPKAPENLYTGGSHVLSAMGATLAVAFIAAL